MPPSRTQKRSARGLGEHPSNSYTNDKASNPYSSDAGSLLTAPSSSQGSSSTLGVATPHEYHLAEPTAADIDELLCRARGGKRGTTPRPRNSFILFRMWHKSAMKMDDDSGFAGNISLSIGAAESWKRASARTKSIFEDAARRDAERHRAEFAGYRYSPRGSKERQANGDAPPSRKTKRRTSSPVSVARTAPPPQPFMVMLPEARERQMEAVASDSDYTLPVGSIGELRSLADPSWWSAAGPSHTGFHYDAPSVVQEEAILSQHMLDLDSFAPAQVEENQFAFEFDSSIIAAAAAIMAAREFGQSGLHPGADADCSPVQPTSGSPSASARWDSAVEFNSGCASHSVAWGQYDAPGLTRWTAYSPGAVQGDLAVDSGNSVFAANAVEACPSLNVFDFEREVRMLFGDGCAGQGWETYGLTTDFRS